MNEFHAKFHLAEQEQNHGKEDMHGTASHRLPKRRQEPKVASGLRLVQPQTSASVCFQASEALGVRGVLMHRKLLFA